MSGLRDSAPADAPGIIVTVTLFADLRRFLPRGADGPQRYTVPEGATVADLLAAVGIESREDVTAAVDGELAGRDTVLREGAEVMLLSPMEGGAAGAGEATISRDGPVPSPHAAMEGGAAAVGEATISRDGPVPSAHAAMEVG